MYWYEKENATRTLVLSTRVRFARNLEGIPFPHRLSPEEGEKVFARVKEALAPYRPMAIPFGETEKIIKDTYVQTHLASRELGEKGVGSGLILDREGDVSVMVGEEDHIRLQVIRAGRDVDGALLKAKEWVETLEKALPIAYRKGLGYLTACPTNLGGAMRLSVMIHLPALTASGAIPTLAKRLGDRGFTVRGFFGEGSREGGSIYQISNQSSREKTPEEVAELFSSLLSQVEEWEKKSAEALLERDRNGWEDRILRALGTLKYARKMNYDEFIGLYSLVRFGRECAVAGTEGTECLDRLMVELLPAPMILQDRSLADAQARDLKRSRIIREQLSGKEK